jgi:hypothetical protein
MNEMNQDMKDKLIRNITDQIKESQIKLGYVKETVYLYYPVESLNALLGVNVGDEFEMISLLKNGFDDEKTCLGKIGYHIRKGRVEISVPSEGVEYVHKVVKESPFLVDLIRLFREHHSCSQEDLKNLFSKYSPEYICEQMEEGSDFDYVMYFCDREIDPYYYCMKEEMGHTIYHRFTKEDYELFIN